MYEEILARMEEAMEKGRIDGHAVYTIILMSRRIIEHVTVGTPVLVNKGRYWCLLSFYKNLILFFVTKCALNAY